MLDWCAEAPVNGAGFAVTQFQPSPPSPLPTAPAGMRSSTHRKLLTGPFVPLPGVEFVPPPAFVLNVLTPARSQAARPPYMVNAMPRMVLPSRPTAIAGTSRRTHLPNTGTAPIDLRLSVPRTP